MRAVSPRMAAARACAPQVNASATGARAGPAAGDCGADARAGRADGHSGAGPSQLRR